MCKKIIAIALSFIFSITFNPIVYGANNLYLHHELEYEYSQIMDFIGSNPFY